MRSTLLGFTLSVAAAAMIAPLSATAQSERYKAEFFAGYSHNRVDTGLTSEDVDEIGEAFGKTLGANGVNFSITGNVSKFVGLKFDFATHGKTEQVSFEGNQFSLNGRITNYLGGIQIKNNSKDGPRVKPFMHALAGIASQKITVDGPPSIIGGSGTSNVQLLKISQNNFALAIGGGIDVRVHRRVDIRIFQIDWNPTYLKGEEFDDFELDGMMQNNFRFGFGIVIH